MEIITTKGMNYALIGFLMVIIGMTSNNFVIAHNNGRMPVLNYVEDSKIITSLHSQLAEDTNYPYLSDIFWNFSIGDMLMFIGLIIVVIGIHKDKNLKKIVGRTR